MNLQSTVFCTTFPNALHYQPAATLAFPSVAEASDIYLNTGSGIGTGSTAIKTAIGEYLERRHFYIEIAADTKGCLSYDLSKKEVNSFVKSFIQTNSENLKAKHLESHKYQLTKVLRLNDFTPCHIPTVCLSLQPLRQNQDNAIYPWRDTCGCCFHWSPEASMLGALKEHLERQFLLRFWLTKTCTSKLSTQEILRTLEAHQAYTLCKALSLSGELIALDISDSNFPGRCILVIYGQKNKDRNVKYCAGLSYAPTQAMALEKATNELWQTFRFMNLFASINGDTNKLHDSYLRYFLSCNNYETFNLINNCTTKQNIASPTRYTFNLQGLRRAVTDNKISGYFYTKMRILHGNTYLLSKFISPDLFMHMNNAKNINLSNHYSSKFKKEMIEKQKSIMVPFP